jgi:hypothetical protein
MSHPVKYNQFKRVKKEDQKKFDYEKEKNRMKGEMPVRPSKFENMKYAGISNGNGKKGTSVYSTWDGAHTKQN